MMHLEPVVEVAQFMREAAQRVQEKLALRQHGTAFVEVARELNAIKGEGQCPFCNEEMTNIYHPLDCPKRPQHSAEELAAIRGRQERRAFERRHNLEGLVDDDD